MSLARSVPLASTAAPIRQRLLLPVRSWMVTVAVVVTLLALLPLGFVVWSTVETGWATASALIFRPRVGDLLANSLLLILLAVPISTVLALALAWLTVRSDLAGGRMWAWLLVAPLAVPAFVQSYAWVSLVPSLHGLFGGVLVSVLAYFPFLYLPIFATLRRLDPALEDSAASLGVGPWKIFLRVTLPQLRLAILGGGLLVGLHLLSEYGLYAMIRFDTFTTAIVDQFQSTFDGPAGTMLAVVLVACCLGLLGVENVARGDERYARVGAGAPRLAAPVRLGRLATPCLLLPAVTVLLALGVPFLTIGRWLVAGGTKVLDMGEILPALWQTLSLALVGGLLTLAAALPIAWLAVRGRGALPRLLESCGYVVGSLPSVVVALAVVSVTARLLFPLYQTLFTILAAYAIMFLPRAIIGLRASLAQVPVELEHAAASLGKSPARALWATTIRLAAPGAAAGMTLASLGILNELTATQMLAPNGTRTLAMGFWSYSSELDYAAAAPYAFIMIVISLPLTWLLFLQSRRLADR